MSLLQVIENTRRRRRIFLSQNYYNSPLNSLLITRIILSLESIKKSVKSPPLMLGPSLVYIDELRRWDASWQVAKISLDELAQVATFKKVAFENIQVA